jgi:hypothetical protein
VKYGLTSKSNKRCPNLLEDSGKFNCSLIDMDPEAREVLLSGDCDDPALKSLKKKFDAVSIVKEYFPDVERDKAEYILWEKTSFPDFWNIPNDGWTAQQCLRTELKRLVENS